MNRAVGVIKRASEPKSDPSHAKWINSLGC